MIKKKLVQVEDIKIGMFVEELDKPWLETPYLLEGLLIDSQSDIDELSRHCKFVYVTEADESSYTRTPLIYRPHVHKIPEEEKQKTLFHGNQIYINKQTIKQELPAARKAHNHAQILINQIKHDIDQDCVLNVDAAKELVHVIARSIINNPNAMLLLNRFKTNMDGQYERALSSSIYMITFGRHLCLPTDELAILGLGGLLMDIGKIKLLSQHTDVTPNSPEEHEIAVQHVTYGEEILSQMPGIPKEVIQITMQHHEREDGSGFPFGLRGNQIAPYSRMAAIVDCYEKIILERSTPDSPPCTPFEALNILWDWTRRWLNATLVQRFAHCIGLFPVGSLVELNSGEVAIVLSHSRSNRFQPLIMVVLDINKKPYNAPKTLDLSLNKKNANGMPYQITKDLKSDAYEINPKKYYL